MAKNKLSRRNFIGTATVGLAGAAMTMSAKSYSKIIGANDRINIGFLGCGARGSDHQTMVKNSEKDKNLAVVAVCDIWKYNRELHASICKTKFGEN